MNAAAASSKQQSLQECLKPKNKIPLHSPQGEQLTNAVMRYIIRDLRPISSVENEGFRELLKEFTLRFDITSKNYFRDTVLSHMYENVKAKVKFQLTNGVERHSITTDGWTSQSTVDYVTITVHFINPECQLLSYVLQTRPLGDQHTADNLAEMLKEAKVEWKLADVFGVTDNAKNITKPFQDILKWPHLGCIGHTLNLSVVKAFSLGSVSKLLVKCRKIVCYFKRSTTATRIL